MGILVITMLNKLQFIKRRFYYGIFMVILLGNFIL